MADALNEVEDDETMTESQEYGGDESTKLSDTDKKKTDRSSQTSPLPLGLDRSSGQTEETRFIERTGRKL